jgi:hypothetical protein
MSSGGQVGQERCRLFLSREGGRRWSWIQVITWATLGAVGGIILGARGGFRPSDPLLGATLGPLGDALVGGIVWATFGGVIGLIIGARPLHGETVRGIASGAVQAVFVAVLWALVLAAAWVFLGLFLTLFLDGFLTGSVFPTVLGASSRAVVEVSYGACLCALFVLLRSILHRTTR